MPRISYKNRCKELERALYGIGELCSIWNSPEDDAKIPVADIIKVIHVVTKGGVLDDARIFVTKHSLNSGKEIQVPLGCPGYLDPSTETYWSM
jgi:hypothetical protein